MKRAALAIVMLAALVGAAPDDELSRERWYEILGPQGQLVGYQIEGETAVPGGMELRRERHMAYRIEGHEVSRQSSVLVRYVDRNGALISFRSDQSHGARDMAVLGAVQGGVLRLARDYGDKHAERTIAFPAGGKLGDSLAAEQESGTLFELADSGLALEPRELVTLTPPGKDRTLRLGRINGQLDSAEFVYRDPEGAVERIELPQIGYALTMRRSARPIRHAELAQVQNLPHEMWRSPFYVAKEALRGHIRYRLALPAGLGASIPETGEQRVRLDEGASLLDICPACGPGLASDPAALARWTRPTPWLESDAAELRKAVRAVQVRKGNERAAMIRLGQIARRRLGGVDYEGHLTASAAWRARSGDCTEDAVLLAALARAAGIPARVANGLVYSRGRYHGAANAFLPHSWVVAWVDGRWESFDISLEGFDASHIALTVGEGEPGSIVAANRLAALLEWQAMSEVRTRD